MVSSNANGTNVSYAWDADNRLHTVTDNRNGGTTTYAYDATSQVASFAYPNGVSQAYLYDSRDRPANLNVTGPSGTLASYTQAFSDSSHKQSVAEVTGRTENYAYDSIYRLLNENIAGDPAPQRELVPQFVPRAAPNRRLAGSLQLRATPFRLGPSHSGTVRSASRCRSIQCWGGARDLKRRPLAPHAHPRSHRGCNR